MQEWTKDPSQQHYLEMYAGVISELGFVCAQRGEPRNFSRMSPQAECAKDLELNDRS
jgi:hypothetical protein